MVFSLAVFVSAMPANGKKKNGAATAAAASSAAGTITRGDSTVVMKEVGGIPGNECLTFRNNGTFSSLPAIPANM